MANSITVEEKSSRYLVFLFASIVISITAIIFYLLHTNMPSEDSLPSTVSDASSNSTQQIPYVKTPLQAAQNKAITPALVWHRITIQAGDNISTIFARLNLSAQQLQALLISANVKDQLENLNPGDTLKIALDIKHNVAQLRYRFAPGKTLVLQRIANHYQASTQQTPLITTLHHARGIIDHSLYNTSINMKVPEKIMLQLAQLFSWQLDFNHDLRPGDQLNLIYDTKDLRGNAVKTGNIVAATITTHHGKTTHTAIRYTNQKGLEDYYMPNGQSLSKAFLRYPLHFAYISSPFSRRGRYHPILHIMRPHLGVDLAANYHTPIHSVADGRIRFLGWEHGYGRVVIIDHGHGYSTLYAHMSAFGKHLHRLSAVHKGQLIGYVGASGLATGPHCHFEFRKNGIHYNPVTVKLPAANRISQANMPKFKQTVKSLTTALATDLH